MSKRFIITGVAGFIGSHLAEKLLHQGHTVLGIDNFDDFYEKSQKQSNLEQVKQTAQSTSGHFEFFEYDINQIAKHSKNFQNIDSLFHIAAKAGVRPSIQNPSAYVHANIDGTLELLKFSVEQKIENFIFASSSSVYGNDTDVPFGEKASTMLPISPYAATKKACELLIYTYCHLYNLKSSALRLFTVYGPRQRPDLAIHKFSKLILQGKPITLFGDGSTSRDYTFVADIVNGFCQAEEWTRQQEPGTYEIFNVGCGSPIQLNELVDALEQSLGSKVTKVYEGMQMGDVNRTFADVSKARNLLGYQPKTKLSHGLAEFASWIKNDLPIKKVS